MLGSLCYSYHMKKIFLTAGEDIIARNILQTDFWRVFTEENKDNAIVLLVRKDKEAHFADVFAGHNVQVIGFEHLPFSRTEKILFSLARSAIKNHTNLWSKMRSYERGDSGLFVTYLKRLYTFIFGGSDGYKKLLRFLILKTKSDKATSKLFDEYKPDVVVALSMTNFEFDVPIAKEAKRRGVKIIGMVRSWDNFSSHGLLRVVPDVLFLQNKFLKKMAFKYQAIDEKMIFDTSVGLPHYDAYKNFDEYLIPKEEFFKMYNLDVSKKLIVYGAMGDFLFPHEPELVDVFEEIIGEGLVSEPAQVFFRIHPKFPNALDKVKNAKHVLADLSPSYLDEGGEDKKLDSKSIFINTLVYADVVISGASTIAIDATVLNKPIICIGFDGTTRESDTGYWPSVKRFYDTYTHFEALMDTGAIKLARTKEELAEQINEYIATPVVDVEKRKKVLDMFVEPFDGHAGERVAKQISKEIKKV